MKHSFTCCAESPTCNAAVRAARTIAAIAPSAAWLARAAQDARRLPVRLFQNGYFFAARFFLTAAFPGSNPAS